MILDIGKCILTDERTGYNLMIIPYNVASEIIDKLHVATIFETNQMLLYKDGKYVENGELEVTQILARELGFHKNKKGIPMYNKAVKNEILDSLKDRTRVHLNEFDTNLDIINMKNGLFNWRSGDLSPHTPVYLSRIQVPINYNKDATCEELEEILRTIIQPEDYIKVQEFIAYLFYRAYEIQKAFILFGAGGTGKSSFLKMVGAMVGTNNCSSVPFGEMDRFFSRATLQDKLLNSCGELDANAVKRTDFFKTATSGLEQMQAEFKYGQPFWFVNCAKMMWATNSLPKVFDDTDAFYRRIELIPFLHKFGPEDYDQNRMNAMINPDQLSGLFNLCISRLSNLLMRHDFTNASQIDDIREKYRAASDPLQTFIESHVVTAPEGRVTFSEVYERYECHCKQAKVKPLPVIQFNNKFSGSIKTMRVGTQKFGNKKINVWEGIDIC